MHDLSGPRPRTVSGPHLLLNRSIHSIQHEFIQFPSSRSGRLALPATKIKGWPPRVDRCSQMHMQLRRHAASNFEPHASLIAGPQHNADPKSQPTNQTTDEPMDGERETDPPPPVAAAATGCTPTTSRGSSTASSCSSNSHPSAPASTGTPPSAVVPSAPASTGKPRGTWSAHPRRPPRAGSLRALPPPAGDGGPRSSAATAAPGRCGPSSPSRR